MNAKLILCIAAGAFVAHLSIFMIYVRLTFHPEIPKPTPVPNFKVAEEVVRDRDGGKIVNREFTISTRLAPPGTYKGPAEKPVND